ncbi:MAG: hypothetical protein PHT52_07770 [Eubacteriales bacterium]|nr:hypothetical protein [Eubacteriales bacterium]
MFRVLAASCLLLLFLAGPVSAAGGVRLVIMDGINLEHLQLEEYGNFRFLMEHGALGLANANTAGARSRENAVLTLASGSRALGPGAGEIYGGEEELETGTAAVVHARCTGVSPPPGALVLPGIAVIAEANGDLLHTVRIGCLADSLKAAGKTAAALVNGDKSGNYREGAAIVADSDGIVQGGSVETALADNPELPFGLQSDLRAFVAAVRDYQDADLLVIDLGDTSRAQDYFPLVVADKGEAFRRQALIQLDSFLGELLRLHKADDLLLVVGLQADRTLAREEGKLLVPVLVYGQGFQGLLTSPTTRRQGVVANIDVTATILQFFDLYRPGEIYGQPLVSLSHPDPQGYLLQREREMAAVYRLRSPLIKGFIAIIIILVGLSLAAFFFKWRNLSLLKLLLLMVVATPLALLVLGAIPGSLWLLPAWVALTLGIALALRRLEPVKAMVLLGAVTALLIVVDALLGAWLQQRSILGYDAIAGPRYYGIGNEYMGALLGSSLLGLSGLLTKNKWLAGVILAGIVLVLMLPGVGANFGGALAALVGYTIALTGFSLATNKKYRLPAVLVFATAVLVLVLVNLGGNQSHVGRFFTAVAADPREFWQVVQRKLSMNWRLIRWSLWSKAFAALFAAALWIFFSQRRVMAQRFGRFWPQVRGALAAALAALAFNDSGIVAAATTLLFMTLPLLYYWFSSNSSARDSHSL